MLHGGHLYLCFRQKALYKSTLTFLDKQILMLYFLLIIWLMRLKTMMFTKQILRLRRLLTFESLFSSDIDTGHCWLSLNDYIKTTNKGGEIVIEDICTIKYHRN